MSGLAAAAIGAAPGLIEGAVGLFTGASQKRQAAQIAKNNPFIPEQLPGQVKQATQLAAQNYTNGMPGITAAKQQISQNAGDAEAAVAKGASSSGDILDSANKINNNSQNASLELAMQAASYKSNALGGYEAALNTEGQWEDKLYKNNQLDPYLRAANTAASLEGAGNINEFKGLDEAVGGLQTGYQDFSNSKTAGQFTFGNPRGPQINGGQTPTTGLNTSNINSLMAASMYNLNP